MLCNVSLQILNQRTSNRIAELLELRKRGLSLESLKLLFACRPPPLFPRNKYTLVEPSTSQQPIQYILATIIFACYYCPISISISKTLINLDIDGLQPRLPQCTSGSHKVMMEKLMTHKLTLTLVHKHIPSNDL